MAGRVQTRQLRGVTLALSSPATRSDASCAAVGIGMDPRPQLSSRRGILQVPALCARAGAATVENRPVHVKHKTTGARVVYPFAPTHQFCG